MKWLWKSWKMKSLTLELQKCSISLDSARKNLWINKKKTHFSALPQAGHKQHRCRANSSLERMGRSRSWNAAFSNHISWYAFTIIVFLLELSFDGKLQTDKKLSLYFHCEEKRNVSIDGFPRNYHQRYAWAIEISKFSDPRKLSFGWFDFLSPPEPNRLLCIVQLSVSTRWGDSRCNG